MSVLVTFLALFGLVLLGCEEEDDFRIVELGWEGAEEDVEWTSFSLFPHVFVPSEEGGPTRMPLRGEMDLWVSVDGDEFWLPILDSDRDTLVFSSDDFLIRLGGAPILLDLTLAEGWAWLEGANAEEKGTLRAIAIQDTLTPLNRALLEDLAHLNPGLYLYSGGGVALLSQLTALDPVSVTVAGADLGEDLLAALAQEPALRRLVVEGGDLSNVDFLARLPSLEHLWLGGSGLHGIGGLPDSLPGLKSLMLMEPRIADLTPLGNQPFLEELTILGCAGDPETGDLDVRGISRFTRLKLVSIRGCELADPSPLFDLPDLDWLAVPAGTNQAQFEELMAAQPELAFLEVNESADITDLTPLTRLAELRGLIVAGDAPLDPVFTMDHLQYLAVVVDEDDIAFGEELLPRLKAELPETVIGRIQPFCLGSGLILLLVPMVGLGWLALGGRWTWRRPGDEDA